MKEMILKFSSIVLVLGLFLTSQVSWASSETTAEVLCVSLCAGGEDIPCLMEWGCPTVDGSEEDSQKYIGETEKYIGETEKGLIQEVYRTRGMDIKTNRPN